MSDENNKLKTHFKLVLLYKKVIESAIELENESTRENYFGYRLSESSEDDIYFRDSETFYSLMVNKKIILKTKVEYAKMYFPMYILSLIINLNIFRLTEYGIIDDYIVKYLQPNNLMEENMNHKNKKNVLKKMLEESGNFWINHSGIPNIENGNENFPIYFDFSESYIMIYELKDEVYKARREREFKGKKQIVIIDEIDCISKLSKEARFLKNLKDCSKFAHNKEDELIEYTLQDILNYLNIQLESYEIYKQMNEVQEEASKEAKNPKMIQRCLDAGQSIEEALDSVGFN